MAAEFERNGKIIHLSDKDEAWLNAFVELGLGVSMTPGDLNEYMAERVDPAGNPYDNDAYPSILNLQNAGFTCGVKTPGEPRKNKNGHYSINASFEFVVTEEGHAYAAKISNDAQGKEE